MMRYKSEPPCSVLLLCLMQLLCAADEIKLTVNESLCHNESTCSDRFPQLDVSTVHRSDSQSPCSVCVRVHVTMRAADFKGNMTITYLGLSTSTRRIISIKRLKRVKHYRFQWKESQLLYSGKTQIKPLNLQSIGQQNLWEFVLGCFPSDPGQQVTVFLSTTPEREKTDIVQNICPVSQVPKFNLSVDETAQSLAITITTGSSINLPASSSDVHARMCYRQEESACLEISPLITINTTQSPSVNLTFPFLLPCVCVQVYYTHLDAKRTTICPFVNSSLDGNRDMWRSSEVTLYGEMGSSLTWSSPCPPTDLKPSASLCWNHSSLCTPILNSNLEDSVENGELKYNVSVVDKHPQMCVQFSFRGSHDVHCPFRSDMSKWEAYAGPGSKGLTVYFTSGVPASFAAQLCVQEEKGCVSRGDIYSVEMFEGAKETQLNLPVPILTEGLCVQVWRSDVALCGRRLLCFDYFHRRKGLLAFFALTVLVTVAMLGIGLHYVIKKGVTGWFSIQRPVLLVCSSEQAEHVSAVCTLASILHSELGADVRMALWTQSSVGSGPGTTGSSGVGVAQLGPVPWLYGQWEAVREAGGRVLIIWSPEVKESYGKWREEREGRRTTGEGMRRGESDGEHLEGLGNIGVEPKRAELRRGEEWAENHWEHSSVTWPVFRAALSCLQGALQMGGRGHCFALVYFQGLCHSRDIPKDLRSVPRYSLPRDFGDLIQELGRLAGLRKSCWCRLLSKTLSLWLAQRLAHRLDCHGRDLLKSS